MTRKLALTAVYETVDEGWVQAHVEEMPGVITAAPSLVEAKELLLDALQEYLLALGSQTDASPQQGDVTREPLEISLTA